MKYTDYDALGLANLVHTRQTSPEELVKMAFDEIEKKNKGVNAVVRTRKEKALQEAKNVNLQKKFAGVPIVLKDLGQAIGGELNTCGAKLLQNYITKEDSLYTQKIRQAGFIIIGQTNTPEFGFKNITDPTLFGETSNPWCLSHSPGGSSGGASASVASGMVPIAGASDGGGSIRIPASFTSLVGLKVTRGRTPVGKSERKWQGAAVDFALTRSVRDACAMLDALQILEPYAAFNVPLFNDGYLNMLQNNYKRKLSIAYTTKSPVGTFVSEDAKLAVEKTIKWLEQEGHLVEEVDNDVDGFNLINSYFTMNGVETVSMFSHIEKNMNYEIKRDDVEIMTWAIYTMGKSVNASEYAVSFIAWDDAAYKMSQLHKKYDFYLTPSTSVTAPLHKELSPTQIMRDKICNMHELSYKQQKEFIYDMFEQSLAVSPFTQLANLTGQPAISLPVHLSKEGMPIGVQFIGPKGKEDELLKIASQIEISDIWVGMKGNEFI